MGCIRMGEMDYAMFNKMQHLAKEQGKCMLEAGRAELSLDGNFFLLLPDHVAVFL